MLVFKNWGCSLYDRERDIFLGAKRDPPIYGRLPSNSLHDPLGPFSPHAFWKSPFAYDLSRALVEQKFIFLWLPGPNIK